MMSAEVLEVTSPRALTSAHTPRGSAVFSSHACSARSTSISPRCRLLLPASLAPLSSAHTSLVSRQSSLRARSPSSGALYARVHSLRARVHSLHARVLMWHGHRDGKDTGMPWTQGWHEHRDGLDTEMAWTGHSDDMGHSNTQTHDRERRVKEPRKKR